MPLAAPAAGADRLGAAPATPHAHIQRCPGSTASPLQATISHLLRPVDRQLGGGELRGSCRVERRCGGVLRRGSMPPPAAPQPLASLAGPSSGSTWAEPQLLSCSHSHVAGWQEMGVGEWGQVWGQQGSRERQRQLQQGGSREDAGDQSGELSFAASRRG